MSPLHMGDLRISQAGPFHVGVAYSPHYGHNFGDDVWDVRHGLHYPDRAEQLRRDFAEYARHGVTIISMKVFDDGRTGIDFDARDPGIAVGVHASALEGIAQVLEAAQGSGVHLHLVLFDHLFAYPAGPGRARGHGGAFSSEHAQDALFEIVILPVLRLAGRHPHLMSVELINEPDLIGKGLHGHRWDRRGRWFTKVKLPDLLAAMRRLRDLLDTETDAQFAISCLGVGKARYWVETGLLDPQRHFLSVHYFDNPWNGDPSYAGLYGPDGVATYLAGELPMVWGEHPADGRPASSLLQFLEDARRHGVKSCWAWAAYDGRGTEGGDGFGPLQLAQYDVFVSRPVTT